MVPNGVEDNNRGESHLGKETLKKGIHERLMFLMHFTVRVFIAYTLSFKTHTTLFYLSMYVLFKPCVQEPYTADDTFLNGKLGSRKQK